MELQEGQYRYPYHYIPQFSENRYTQLQYWAWGYRYLGGIEVILKKLQQINFESMLDVGCGDGRFLMEVSRVHAQKELLGIDISKRAIKLAKAMNSSQEFMVLDISVSELNQKYDVVTAIEVLEHIPPERVSKILRGIHRSMNQGAYLLMTVPHRNKPLSEKHYQHFDSGGIADLLSPLFHNLEIVPFDKKSTLLKGIQKLLGGNGQNYVINNAKILNTFFGLYRKKFLYADSEQDCLRLAVFCQK